MEAEAPWFKEIKWICAVEVVYLGKKIIITVFLA